MKYRTLGTLALAFSAFFGSSPVIANAENAPSPQPSAPARQALEDAWWTGPMLAAGAGTLPKGHFLVEPYVYDIVRFAHFDRSGARTSASRTNNYGSLSYILYGFANRFTAGVIPTVSYVKVAGDGSSSHVGFGDLSVLGQYRLTQYHLGSWVPTTSIVVQETLPTAKYDRLGNNPNDGFGSGVYTTTVSFYAQSYFWTHNGRILRTRIDASQAFSSPAAVNDVSVYGTSSGFHGTAKPGSAFFIDVSQEYSVTRSWVLALDEYYRHDNNTHVSGGNVAFDSGPSDTFALAPAVEYSWTPNVGVLLGVRWIPAGRNTSATIAPVAAINIFH